MVLLILSVAVVPMTEIRAEAAGYTYSETATSGSVTLKVEWNEPVLGQATTFHVSATGGSGNYRFRMDAPSYSNPGERAFESVADPSRGEWTEYTTECASHDYEFTMTATGTYNFRFYVMDKTSGVYYLRVSSNLVVQDDAYPSVSSIVASAVAQCNQETNGSDYAKALWLHDWLLEQLDYDNSLKWSSSESALTRGTGTCQAYESAYAMLLTAAGIENAETRDTYDGHTWNAMKLDGEWYQVDCTWDDSNDKFYNFDNRHLYFGLTDELMAIAHKGHAKIYTADGYGTPSTSLKDNYYIKNGDAENWAESYRERIQQKLDAQSTEFAIVADNASYPPSISGIQNGVIAYAINQIDWSNENMEIQLTAVGDAAQFTFTVQYTDKSPEPEPEPTPEPKPEHTQHVWDGGVVTAEPTCTATGTRRYTCTVCQETKTETIAAKGHTFASDWTVDKEATCTEAGSKSHHCTRCGVSKDVTEIAAKGHSWDGGDITQQPTHETEGIRKYTCQICSATREEKLAKCRPIIKGKCQMPYSGEQGTGYLIGVESYDNPGQKYQYEMLILDCTLLAQGKPAWTYTTGKFTVSQGNAGWCIWTPQYGYYWTLFRVYDENGVLIDEQCYGFENIC